ncbi:MAG: hypothetical protein QM730_24915 [Anaerolineales bacterium]
MPLKRPLGVTLLLWMVLSLSAWGAVRFAASLRWWDVLSMFDSRLSPVYLSISGAGWVLAGGVLIWGALSRKRWAYPAIPTYFILWLTVYWIERVLLSIPKTEPAIRPDHVVVIFSGDVSLRTAQKHEKFSYQKRGIWATQLTFNICRS